LDEAPKSDGMLLDDTKYTSYIYDIDREIEDIESQKDHIVFLPEIEKALTAIPRAILNQPKPSNNELVLYRPPEYFAIPVDKRQVKEPPTNVISSLIPRSISGNGKLRQPTSDNMHDRGSPKAQDDMDVDL